VVLEKIVAPQTMNQNADSEAQPADTEMIEKPSNKMDKPNPRLVIPEVTTKEKRKVGRPRKSRDQDTRQLKLNFKTE